MKYTITNLYDKIKANEKKFKETNNSYAKNFNTAV